jgi:hypothetical protein
MFLIGILFLAACQAAESGESYLAVKLYNGLEYKGVQQTDDKETLVLRTSLGEVRIRQTDIISRRTFLSDEETREIKNGLATKESAPPKQSTKSQGSAEAPRLKAPLDEIASERPTRDTRPASPSAGSYPDPYERMARSLERRLTFEFVDTPLADAIQFMSEMTGVNFILDPKVRAAKPVVTLQIKDMNAYAAVNWLTRLTGTYAEVKDQAVFITDKPSAEQEDAERQHIMSLAASMGATVELPPADQPLTDADRAKIALKLWEKEEPKVVDFPGPSLELGTGAGNGTAQAPSAQFK